MGTQAPEPPARAEFFIFLLLVLFGYKYFIRYVICKYFLPVLTYILILLTVYFTEQKFHILMNSNLANFPSMDCAFVLYQKDYCQNKVT